MDPWEVALTSIKAFTNNYPVKVQVYATEGLGANPSDLEKLILSKREKFRWELTHGLNNVEVFFPYDAKMEILSRDYDDEKDRYTSIFMGSDLVLIIYTGKQVREIVDFILNKYDFLPKKAYFFVHDEEFKQLPTDCPIHKLPSDQVIHYSIQELEKSNLASRILFGVAKTFQARMGFRNMTTQVAK